MMKNKTITTKPWLPLILILAIASFFYFHNLGNESLWEDEFYSIYDAKNIDITKASVFSHPRPIYFLLLQIWMFFGNNEAFLRSLSIPFGLGSITLIYLIGENLFNRSSGLIAAILLACSPLFINHVQEIRFYAVSVFLNLSGTLILIHALKNPKKNMVYSWAFLRAITILTTPLNLLLLLPDCIIICCMFFREKSNLLIFFQGLVIIGVLWLPSAIFFVNEAAPAYLKEWVNTNQKPGLAEVLIILKQFVFYPPYSSELPLTLNILYKLCTLLIVILTAIALTYQKKYSNILQVLAWATLPSGFVFILAFVRNSSGLWMARYLLIVCPYIFLLLSVGFLKVCHFKRIIAFLISIIYFLGISGGIYYYYKLPNRTDWRSAMQFIKDNHEEKDDIILYTVDADSVIQKLILGASYYYDDFQETYLLSHKNPSQRSLTSSEVNKVLRKINHDSSLKFDQKSDLYDPRLWVVCFLYCEDQNTTTGLEQTFTDKGFSIQKHQKFKDRLQVFLFN